MKRMMLMLLIILLCLPLAGLGESYRLQLEAAFPIFHGPGYDEGYARTVGEDGIFTILEEQWDEEGNRWGRLKSGVGWVNLTYLYSNAWRLPPLTACLGEDVDFSGRLHLHYQAPDCQFPSVLAFFPRQRLLNVELSRLEWGEEEMLQHPYCRIDALELPLVAEMEFFGDATVYCLTFWDEAGQFHAYELYISGRSGELVMTPRAH